MVRTATKVILVAMMLWAELFDKSAVAFEDTPDNKTAWLNLTCISLKQGNSINNAQFCLHQNGTISFKIQGEQLKIIKGSYNRQSIQFSAQIEFLLKREKTYRYVITLRGISILNGYVGFASLKEYIRNNTFSQEIPFLFIASEGREEMPNKKFPFFMQ